MEHFTDWDDAESAVALGDWEGTRTLRLDDCYGPEGIRGGFDIVAEHVQDNWGWGSGRIVRHSADRFDASTFDGSVLKFKVEGYDIVQLCDAAGCRNPGKGRGGRYGSDWVCGRHGAKDRGSAGLASALVVAVVLFVAAVVLPAVAAAAPIGGAL